MTAMPTTDIDQWVRLAEISSFPSQPSRYYAQEIAFSKSRVTSTVPHCVFFSNNSTYIDDICLFAARSWFYFGGITYSVYHTAVSVVSTLSRCSTGEIMCQLTARHAHMLQRLAARNSCHGRHATTISSRAQFLPHAIRASLRLNDRYPSSPHLSAPKSIISKTPSDIKCLL